LQTGTKPATSSAGYGTLALAALCAVAFSIAGYAGYKRLSQGRLDASKSALPAALPGPDVQLGALRVGGETAQKLAKALNPMDPTTRNAAVKLAARTEGPFHVEQVAEVWAGVRKEWRYVNDPQGREYFASASESIQNGYIGDCDDFAVTLASMVIAIGGKARVVLMDGPRGGHAYAEACVQGEPSKVASALLKHYKTKFKRYLTDSAPKSISYRASTDCPIWLNLDWSAAVPGGPYEKEQWAVAIYESGQTEEIVPASPSEGSGATSGPAAGAP
jgi:transglutaminase-like putative cysteine protease